MIYILGYTFAVIVSFTTGFYYGNYYQKKQKISTVVEESKKQIAEELKQIQTNNLRKNGIFPNETTNQKNKI